MHLLYHLSPNLSAGYVYNLRYPNVHALAPDAITWTEGPGFTCPPNAMCAPAP